MKWENRTPSENVEVDCLGSRTKDLDAGLACQNEVKELRQHYANNPGDFDKVKRAFDLNTGSYGSDNQSFMGILPAVDIEPGDRLNQFQKALEDEIDNQPWYKFW